MSKENLEILALSENNDLLDINIFRNIDLKN